MTRTSPLLVLERLTRYHFYHGENGAFSLEEMYNCEEQILAEWLGLDEVQQ